ncbi:MAG: GTPase HflX, partial [Brachybacterium alimentarium]
MPIAFHPEPASDADVDGTTTGGTVGAPHTEGTHEDPSAGSPADPSPAARRRDPLTERILSRSSAAAQDAPGQSSDGEQYDLADRQALRRVAGMSTELEDVSEVEYRQLRLERVVLAGLYTSGNAAEAETSLLELAALAETAGSEVLDGLLQRRAHPDPATFFGKGKAAELAGIIAENGADTVIADGELGPGQRRALEDIVKVKVIDRTALI